MQSKLRILKISTALILTGLSLWAILLPPYFPSSSHAIINSRKIQISSRADGVIAKLHISARDTLGNGQAIALIHIDQALITTELEQLQFLEKRLITQIANDELELKQRKLELNKASEEFAERARKNVESLGAELREALAKVDIEQKQRDLLLEDVKRIRGLVDKGIVTRTKWLELSKVALEAEQQLQDAQSDSKRLSNELELAKAGLNASKSENDDALTAEIAAMRHEIRNLESGLSSIKLQLSETESLIAQCQSRLAESNTLTVTSPSDALVWNCLGVEGQNVAIGQPLATLADRRSIFVEAFFHRYYEGSIAPGDHAFIQVKGRKSMVSGKVLEVTAQEHGAEGINVINSVAPSSSMLRVTIQVEKQQLSLADIGKLGKAVITSNEPGFVNRTLVWLSLMLRNRS